MMWYKDIHKVNRLLINIIWFYRVYHIQPPVPIPAARPIRLFGGDDIKTLIKDVKDLLGYLKPYQYWASGTFPRLINVIHAPSLAGPRAQQRGVQRRYARAHPVPHTREELAKAILASPNADFSFVSPSGGSAAGPLRQAAAGQCSTVAASNASHHCAYIDVRILAFTWDLLHYGRVGINCLTNGRHMDGSQHYDGDADDIDKGITSSSALEHLYPVAERHGLIVLNEDAGHYHVHTP